MAEPSSIPSKYTDTHTHTIQEIICLHSKIQELRKVLGERPWQKEKEEDIDKARETLQELLLVPAVDAFTCAVKDASEKMSDWTHLMDVMVEIKKEDPLAPDVENAMNKLKVAVKHLTAIMLALREKFYA